MAYKHDSEESRIDKGLLIAKIIGSIFIVIIAIVVIKIVNRSLFSDEDKMDLLKLQIDAEMLKETVNYHTTVNDGTLEVSMWEDGSVKTAKNAASGDADSIKSWEKTKERVQYLSSVLYEKRTIADLPDTIVVLKLVNEENHARALLVCKNGYLIYDVTEGG